VSEFTAFEHAGWQKAAGAYEVGYLPVTRQAIEPVLDAAHVTAGTRMLDLASGPGDLAAAAFARDAHVIGTDFSEAMLAVARRRHPRVEFRVADAQALPFVDGEFDAVTATFLLGHLDDPDRALHEARRVLRPGGRFAFAWWQQPDRAVTFGIVRTAVEAHGDLNVALPAGPPMDRFADGDECRRAMNDLGYGEIVVRDTPLVWRPPSADAVIEAYFTAGVRTTALLQAQTPEAQQAIRVAILKALEPYATPLGLELPMSVWVVSGRKP
jgi:SAM-dependent methyltransferase